MKKIMNQPEQFVADMLAGIAAASDHLALDREYGIIHRQEKRSKVGLVSGGGSGHEPAHAGYVGSGMLDAAVAGNVFASPSAEQVLHGIQTADQGKGVLLIIKNYSGDIMNFQMAAELAELEDIEVEYVIVKDDVAVKDSTYSTGRRGIAGTVFVHKVAGALAEKGASLKAVKAVAQKAADSVRSMGMAGSSCILPGVGTPGFTLGDQEVEIGMGIHGEPGVERTGIKSARELAEILLDKIINDLDYTGSEVALMINGLGATPLSELYILNQEVVSLLESKGIKVDSALVGNYMTALEMAGCSVSLLKLDAELKALLAEPADTLALVKR